MLVLPAVPDSCRLLEKPPYVCNGCPKRNRSCTLQKHLYDPVSAQKQYHEKLSEARSGISLTEDEIAHLNGIVSPLLKKKQSLHHICVNHPDSVMVSESTMYRLIEYGLFDAKNIDLPRKVRYARRKKKKVYKVDKSCRLGRTYADYQLYIREHPDLPVTQIDSVEGRKGGHDINSNPWNFYDADGWEMSYLEAFRMDLAEYELIKQMAEER